MFKNRIKIYNYLTILIAFFPILGLKKSVLTIIIWALFSIFIVISEKSYKTISKKDGINLLVLTSYYFAFVISFFFIDDRTLASRFLEKNIVFLLFPLFMIVNKDFISPDTLKKALYSFIFSNLILAAYIWIIILSKGYAETMAADNYYNPTIRNIFSDISGIHLPYLGILFVFSSLILLKDILFSEKKVSILNGVRILAISLLVFSVVAFAARLALFSFLLVSLFLIFKITKTVGIRIAFILGFFLLLLTVLMVPSSKKRIDNVFNSKLILPNKTQNSSEVNFRYGIYHCAGTILKENWITGVGPGNVQKKLDDCYSSYTYKNYDDYRHIEYNSHNQYIDICLKYGVFGLIAFLIFLFWGLNTKDLIYHVFLFIILIGLVTENLFDRQIGVVFFTFFNSLFFINKTNYFEKSISSRLAR
jgi:O-antigen ligase